MTTTKIKNANIFLHSNALNLKTLLDKAKKIADLNRRLALYLDPLLRDDCHAANIIGTRLIIIAKNGSVATLIRYQSIDIIKKFKEDPLLQQIKGIQCKVDPTFSHAASYHMRKKMNPLSKETADMINHIADSLSDPNLKKAMKKIASNTKKLTKDII